MHEYSNVQCTMPRAQNRAAKGSILKEDEILFQSGYIIYLWFSLSYTISLLKTEAEIALKFTVQHVVLSKMQQILKRK